MHRSHHAFSLIELLVVISILALLATLILAGVGVAREGSLSMVCQDHLRQFGLAFATYDADNRGRFPTGAWNDLLAPYVVDGGATTIDGARLVNCPVATYSSYGYTGVYYDSITLDGSPKPPQYPFAWVKWAWWSIVPINERAVVRRGEKVVLSERSGAWGDNVLNDRGARRMHGTGGNLLIADGRVVRVAMPGVAKGNLTDATWPAGFKNDPMWRPYNTAASAFIK